jgi:molecular chaperone GrpE
MEEKDTPECAEAAENAESAQEEVFTLTREQMEKMEGLAGQMAALNDQHLRLAAEYDNYRRRTAKEKDGIYADAYADALKGILPILDNLERAVGVSEAEALQKGLSMTLKGAEDALAKMGVTAFGEKGETFDPEKHNAVMHIEDEQFGESEITEVYQKGYAKGDKILRFAMVIVAN